MVAVLASPERTQAQIRADFVAETVRAAQADVAVALEWIVARLSKGQPAHQHNLDHAGLASQVHELRSHLETADERAALLRDRGDDLTDVHRQPSAQAPGRRIGLPDAPGAAAALVGLREVVGRLREVDRGSQPPLAALDRYRDEGVGDAAAELQAAAEAVRKALAGVISAAAALEADLPPLRKADF